MTKKGKRAPESIIKEIKRKTRRTFISEEKIRIVLEGLHFTGFPEEWRHHLLSSVMIAVGNPFECEERCKKQDLPPDTSLLVINNLIMLK